MGFSGGVATANGADFKLDMLHFKEALRERWSDVQIKDVSEGDIDFGMTIKGKFNGFLGSTIKQQQIGWWGDYEEFAEFCVWFRQYVPEEYKLLAWSKMANDYVVISRATTEEQFVKALSDDRFYFEIASPLNSLEILRFLADGFKQDWSEYVGDVSPDGNGDGFWYLRSQQGYIEFNNGKICFDDNNLPFATQFAIWCRRLLSTDQKLTIRGGYYPKPEIEVTTELTSSTTEDELFDFLTKSFQKSNP